MTEEPGEFEKKDGDCECNPPPEITRSPGLTKRVWWGMGFIVVSYIFLGAALPWATYHYGPIGATYTWIASWIPFFAGVAIGGKPAMVMVNEYRKRALKRLVRRRRLRERNPS